MIVQVHTQFTHKFVNPETCGNFPSLADPTAEVYTVAQLIARHEKGLLTNLNIGKDAAYPQFAHLDDRDLEKDFHQEATDRIHLANEMERENKPRLEAIEKAKKEADEKVRAEAQEAAFKAEAAKRGFVPKGEEGKGSPVP